MWAVRAHLPVGGLLQEILLSITKSIVCVFASRPGHQLEGRNKHPSNLITPCLNRQWQRDILPARRHHHGLRSSDCVRVHPQRR